MVKIRLLLGIAISAMVLTGRAYSQSAQIIGLGAQYCTSDPPDTIYGIQPVRKLFGGPGITQIPDAGDTARAIFDPGAAGAGSKTITYHTTSFPVTVYAPVPVTLNPFAPVCENGAAFTLSGGSPAGGTYAVEGTDMTVFNPSVYGPGSHFVTYRLGPEGCNAVSTPQAISVEAIPGIVFNPLPNICLDAGTLTLDQALPSGGIYSGTGVSGNVFYPSVAGPGTHTITYSYNDGVCSNSAFRTITVGTLPPVTFSGLDTMYCDTDPKVLITGFPTSGNGSFIGHGITDNGNGTAWFDPSTTALGYHDITYSYSLPNGCSGSYTQRVRVGTLLVFSGLGTAFCADNPDVAFTYKPLGGTFNSSTGFTDNHDGTAVLSPSTGSPGTRTIRYTYTDIFGCINNLQQAVEIAPIPSVNFAGLNAAGYCKNASIANLVGNHVPGGTFSGPGVIDNGNGTAKFDPAALPAGGPYSINYYFKDPVTGCDNTISRTTSVLSLPSAMISGNHTVCSGDATTLNVDFTGTAPFIFTWSDGLSSVTVTTSSDPYTLTLNPTSSSVITIPSVTGANGCSTSGTGQGNITVNALSEILDDPDDLTVCPGENAVFRVSASGIALTYQWQKDGSSMPGKTQNVLNLTNVQAANAGSYTCMVTSTCGPALTSNPGVLTVRPQMSMTGQPTGVTDCVGQTVNFNVDVTGSGLHYQWQKDGVNLSNGGRITGATSDNLVILAMNVTDAGTYNCMVTGDCGLLTSDPADLTAEEFVTVTSQPVSKAVCPGSNTSFSVAAAGTNPSYQWQHNNVDIPGATNPVLLISGVSPVDAGNYRCVITGNCGSVASNQAGLTVYDNISIGVQPSDLTTCEGKRADLNVFATGSNLTYQWKKDGTNLSNGGNITGALSPNLIIMG